MAVKEKTLQELILKKKWDQVRARIEKAPHEIRQRKGTQWGGSCLSDAIYHAAPPDITMKLIQAYPKAIRFADDTGEYPLFTACLFGAPVKAFEIMALVYPELLEVKRRFIFRKGIPAQLCKWSAAGWSHDYSMESVTIIELLSKDVSYWKARQLERASG